MKPKPKLCIGYVRVSTDAQATDGVSLESQQARIRQWARDNGYRLAAVYADNGVSGKSIRNRPEAEKAIEAACRKKAMLVCYSLSRLARSTKDLIGIAEKLRQHHADIVSLTEALDTSTATGRLLFGLLAVLSQFEREILAERTVAALAHLKAQGRRISGHIPYGFDLADDGRHLIENAGEQETIALMQQWHEKGRSLRDIADDLNRQGTPTKNNKQWSHVQVHRIVSRS